MEIYPGPALKHLNEEDKEEYHHVEEQEDLVVPDSADQSDD